MDPKILPLPQPNRALDTRRSNTLEWLGTEDINPFHGPEGRNGCLEATAWTCAAAACPYLVMLYAGVEIRKQLPGDMPKEPEIPLNNTSLGVMSLISALPVVAWYLGTGAGGTLFGGTQAPASIPGTAALAWEMYKRSKKGGNPIIISFCTVLCTPCTLGHIAHSARKSGQANQGAVSTAVPLLLMMKGALKRPSPEGTQAEDPLLG